MYVLPKFLLQNPKEPRVLVLINSGNSWLEVDCPEARITESAMIYPE
jgi:hypothetical protein